MRFNYFLFVLAVLVTSCGQNKMNEDTLYVNGLSSKSSADSNSVIYKMPNEPKGRMFIRNIDLNFRVKNIYDATVKIEAMVREYQGYVLKSEIERDIRQSTELSYKKDSNLLYKNIVYSNSMVVKIPNDMADDFLQSLRPLIVFLEYRRIEVTDITEAYKSQKAQRVAYSDAVEKSSANGQNRKDSSSKSNSMLDAKVGEITSREKEQELAYESKFTTVKITIQQPPMVYKEATPDFERIVKNSSSFADRLVVSLVSGWYIVKELILFTASMWGVILYILGAFLLIKVVLRLYRKYKGYWKGKN